MPESHLDVVKQAMFAAGAGDFGNYDQCCWQTKGTGQFRPLEHSNPHLGKQQKLTQLDEYKVEIICKKSHLKNIIDAMLKAHPYEVPAYQIMAFYT